MRTKKSHKKQLDLIPSKIKKEFGGSLLKNSNAKTARPISTQHATHIVLRSSLARGKNSMLAKANSFHVQRIVVTQAKKFQVRIYRFANVGNHMHLLVRCYHRESFKHFLRAVAGLIARLVLRAERGMAKRIRFWDQRPFTRVVMWMKDFRNSAQYVVQNFHEAIGFVDYKLRGKVSRRV